MTIRKSEIIDNVYQPFSKFEKIPDRTKRPIYVGIAIENFSPYRGPIEKDKETGFYYDEQPGWHGEAVQTLDQAMADRTFDTGVLGWRPETL